MEEKVVVKKPPKSSFLAGVLAFFFPTTGALYNGQTKKFFIYFAIFAVVIISLAHEVGSAPFLGIFLGGFYFYQLFDAVQTANRINRRALQGEEEIVEAEEVPEFVKTGSIFWGIVLIALGIFLIFANFELMSYDTVFKFLIPFAVFVVGLKLVVDHYSKSKEEK
jgi:hypothetical protein